MKNLAVVLGVLIVLGVIMLIMLPDRNSSSVTNLEGAPSASQTEGTGAESQNQTEEPASEGTDGTDAGMEFPIPNEGAAGQNFAYDMLVTYTANGFVPQEITVTRGATVRFENQSNQSMWVGSNNHPTHTLYPVKSASDCLGSSFDQCEATGSGTFWDFTFTEAGAFGYHNHRRASDGGTIIVQ